MSEFDHARVRYPKKFEIHRLEALEALGAGPDAPRYYDIDSARERYQGGRTLSVVPDEEPPSWYLRVSAGGRHLAVTFYNEHRTPLRQANWEQTDGELFSRRIVDVFYPEGDPRGRVPFAQVLTVQQEFYTDAVALITVSAPAADGDVREVVGYPTADLRAPIPAFGEWGRVLSASAPAPVARFGAEATDAASEYADRRASLGVVSGARESSGWRIPVSDQGVMRALDAILDGVEAPAGVPVTVRGPARILPLAVQADSRASGRDPHEERRRMQVLADGIRDACEFEAGRPVALDLNREGDDSVAGFARALRAAGATDARWWVFRSTFGVVLVWTGDETAGTLALALHVVPVSWVWDRRAEPGDAPTRPMG